MIRLAAFAVALVSLAAGRPDDPWLVFEGGDGPGKGKHIVLLSGDEEYRSEEAMPQLGKILSKHHGFKCTVLFAIDKKDGSISYRGATYVQTTSPKWARLNSVAVLFEFEVDAQGNTRAQLYEWK